MSATRPLDLLGADELPHGRSASGGDDAADTRVPLPQRLVRGLKAHGTATGSLLVGVVLWEVVGRLAGVSFFPPISAVLARLAELVAEGEILGNLVNSLSNFALGMTICVVVGVPVGLLMGVSRRVRIALDIYVNALLTAPSLVFAPIFFAIFGLSRWSIVAVIVTYGLFIIIVSAQGAVATVDPAVVDMARSYGATRRQLFWRIVFPGSLPMVMAGIRLGAGRAVKGMINGEMFIAAVGLGAIVINAGRTFDAETVLAVLIAITLVALAIAQVIAVIDRRVTAWLPDTARQKR